MFHSKLSNSVAPVKHEQLLQNHIFTIPAHQSTCECETALSIYYHNKGIWKQEAIIV